jgi:transposase-like protein
MISNQQQSQKLSQDLKTKILQEALLPNSSIPKIAKYYNLSPKFIYNYRNQYHKKISKSSNSANSSNSIINTQSDKLYSK